MKEGVAKQFAIFRDKHTWSMTLLYIVTFGSFIGFSMALPLSIKVIFGVSHVPDAAGVMQHTASNPNAPPALTYAWIGPFVGALIRPVGGWIADKVGGSIVTQIISAVMVVASVAVGYVMLLAYRSATPEEYFLVFMLLFVLLFAASGIGNGSTFRTIGVIFDRTQAGPVLGWTSAVAAYGAFIAPVVIGEQIKAGTPEFAMYGFAVFYALCLVLNWWFYLRKNAYVKNPVALFHGLSMSHFLDRLTYFSQSPRKLLRQPRRHHRRRPHVGRQLPQPLGARQDRALDARRQLHRLVLVEDLRQGRHRHVGDPADRLPAHALGHAEPRAARLRARRELQLVSLQREPRQVSDGARPAS